MTTHTVKLDMQQNWVRPIVTHSVSSVHKTVFQTALAAHIFAFLNDRDLRIVNIVNHSFCSAVHVACRFMCYKEGLIPINLQPNVVNYKQLVLHKWNDSIGPSFYQRYLGKVDVIVPIPQNFLEARSKFKLVYIPEYITIKLNKDSPFMLDDTTAIDGKMPRLVYRNNETVFWRESLQKKSPFPSKATKASGDMQAIQVPMTLNNILFLADIYYKPHKPGSTFDGQSIVRVQTILDKHGDVGIGPAHWSYQRKNVLGVGKSYTEQVQLAHDKGLEILSLQERLLFHWLSYLQTGRFPQNHIVERTSTVTGDDVSIRSSIWFQRCLIKGVHWSRLQSPDTYHCYVHILHLEQNRGTGVAAGVSKSPSSL
jgi:hypothetical protein